MFNWQFILFVLYIYLPAMVANSAPIFASKLNALKSLNKPLDYGISWRGQRVLGDNKTIRGLVSGIISGGVVGAILFFLIAQKPYHSFLFALAYGTATGCAALVGDSIKSFLKRRFGIVPGALWIPFDQIDFVIGATVVAMFFVEISLPTILFAIIFIGILSFIVSSLGFALHIKKNL
ncbi:MAG: CDP-archaeol synthase [bacterium]|nr:CDP-archaeol synthase [bacterium]